MKAGTVGTVAVIVLCLGSVATAQLIYDSIRVKVAPGTTCPSGWTAQSETVTTAAESIVTVPASIGGGAFVVSAEFVASVWPSAALRAAAIASGVLVQTAAASATVHYCALLP